MTHPASYTVRLPLVDYIDYRWLFELLNISFKTKISSFDQLIIDNCLKSSCQVRVSKNQPISFYFNFFKKIYFLLVFIECEGCVWIFFDLYLCVVFVFPLKLVVLEQSQQNPFSDVLPMLKYSYTQILKYSNTQILKCSNTQILNCSNTQILKYSNTQIHLRIKYSDTISSFCTIF